jgi:hypothetical protein
MNLAQMRAKFKDRTSGLAESLPDPDIDVFLNRWHQYKLPAKIGRDLMDSIWRLELTPLTDTYDYPDNMIAPKGTSAWIRDKRTSPTDPTIIDIGYTQALETTTDTAWFHTAFQDFPKSSTGAIPTDILFYGRQVIVSPVPDQAYFIDSPARLGPDALTSTGITNEVRALCVVQGSTHEFLMEQEDMPGASREASAFDDNLEDLMTFTESKPHSRLQNRSF